MDKLPGSSWWKVDFHAHTPASFCYAKNHPEKETIRQRPPAEWLLDYMRAQIDCVVVSDHNSGDYVDVLKSTYEQLDPITKSGAQIKLQNYIMTYRKLPLKRHKSKIRGIVY